MMSATRCTTTPAWWRSARPLLLLVLALATLWPASAWAACGVVDPGGCVDGALYNIWYGLAGFGWSLDRTLLLLAYQLDTFRWWLVEIAFTSAYQVLVAIIDPLILPVATLAVILGCLAFLLLPLLGRVSLVNLRHALVWVALAPLVLTLSGPLIVQLEQLRSGVSTALFTGVSALAPGAIFGAAAVDMSAPTLLYPANPCGGSTLTRRSGEGLRLDDLAAALLWADAEDIHCPDRGGPSADIPDRFYEAQPDGPGYARDSDISLLDAGNDRTQAVQQIQRGAIRTFLGLLPAALAVLDALVQLVFALCLIALWIGLPISLVFVFFEQTTSAVTGILRRMLGVLQISWSSSVLLGMVAACLIAAAELRNAAPYAGFAIGGLVLTGYMLLVAVDTFKSGIRTLNDTITTATGLSITRPIELASDTARTALGVGAALASGGVATAVTAAAAYHQTGSGRYAAASAAGRIRPVAQLGEVAAAMGWVDDPELLDGLYAGYRSSAGSWRGTRLQLAADAKRTDTQGRTIHDRAQERRVARELARASRPPIVQALTDMTSHGQMLYDYVGSAQMADDLARAGDWLPARVDAGWQRVRRSWRTDAIPPQQDGTPPGALRQSVATLRQIDDWLRPDARRQVLYLDAQKRVVYQPPPAEQPPHALTAPRSQVRIPRLLMLGYALQERDDGQLIFWQIAPMTPGRRQPPTATPTDERQRLIALGALHEAGELAALPTGTATPSVVLPLPKLVTVYQRRGPDQARRLAEREALLARLDAEIARLAALPEQQAPAADTAEASLDRQQQRAQVLAQHERFRRARERVERRLIMLRQRQSSAVPPTQADSGMEPPDA